MNTSEPCTIDENGDYAVIYKPPKFHSTPANKKTGDENSKNIFDWYGNKSPPVFDLMHRLDFETHGLLLIAKNSKTYEFFKTAQEKGEFVKEYSLVTYHAEAGNINNLQGFPPLPFADVSERVCECSPENPFVIYSFFRPFGEGRKEVRPVLQERNNYETAKDGGSFYKTEVLNRNENVFTVRLKRGFRHQIRCHFFWIGFPILNDPLYTNSIFLTQSYAEEKEEKEFILNPLCSSASSALKFSNNTLALRAHALFFPDPSSDKQKEYRIESLGV